MTQELAKAEAVTPTEIETEDFTVFKASMEAKIKGAAMRESSEKFIRIMHLRQVKERLAPQGQWARWCQETGIDVRNADYEIGKLGDWADDLLTKFVTYVGTDLNKIKYLTNSDYKKLGITAENNQILVKGEPVDLTKEEVQFVIDSFEDDLRKQEEKAAEEKAQYEKEHAETKKALKKAERELKKIKREAEKQNLSPEEVAFFAEMEEIKKSFDQLVERITDAGFNAGDINTPHMMATARTTVDYIKQRVADIWVKEA